jgi:multimeric flavodoxin WrbA
MAHIVFINGSPRRKNCSKMIDFAASMIKEHTYKIINLSQNKVNCCTACDYCKKNDKCIQSDDGNSVNSELEKSDAIVFVTPVYFGNMSGQLKALLDRSVVLRRNSQKLKDKYGLVFATGGSRNGGQELTIQTVMSAMHVHGMIVVGDDSHFGGTIHEPFEKDEFGKETIKASMEKLQRLL